MPKNNAKIYSMYLKSLEISGFKSFAKKGSLEFSSPISAIVGPNGSGKSNIAESFRFALGEQSVKSMRGKKGEDLIWNGTPDVPRQNRASVKVVFDNTRRVLNVDFDEVSIERVIHRDSSSEYLINGSQVRLKDVVELLAGGHIGSSGHHIISQGEADKILNASIKERREMIEDALGLKIYQYKRLESERKLGKTEENIKQVESLRREIAPHIKFLKKQVEKIEKAELMRGELKTLCGEYLKRESLYLKAERARIESEKRNPTEELKKLEAELNNAKKILESSDKKDAKSTKLIELESKISDARSRKDKFMMDLGRIEGEISSLQRLLKKQKEIADRGNQTAVPLVEVEGLAQKINSFINEAESENDFSKIKIILKNIKDQILRFIETNKKIGSESTVADLEKEIQTLSSQKQTTSRDLETAESLSKSLNVEYLKLKEEIEKEKDSSRDAERAVFVIMAKQNELRSKIQALRVFEDKLAHEEEDFKREITEGGVLVGREILDYEKITGIEIETDRTKQEERRRVIEKIKIRLEDSGASSGGDVMKEYKEATERDTFLAKELEDLHKSALSLKQLIEELTMRLDMEFKQGIEKINKQFQEFFALMFGGGTAELSVIREKKKKRTDIDIESLTSDEIPDQEEEEGEEGIDISVNLPRKKIKGLMMLSGGERALTSIALIFAVSQVNPPPFIILDETDAALDEANSRKYGDMIENLSKYSQLILITHNRETMSRAGILYGVTMDKGGFSKLLSIKFDEAVAVAK